MHLIRMSHLSTLLIITHTEYIALGAYDNLDHGQSHLQRIGLMKVTPSMVWSKILIVTNTECIPVMLRYQSDEPLA